jgi:two-component system, chemotaxis family, protein-glutamate methylesterase/glutaminase
VSAERRLEVMVVDDSAVVRQLLKTLLEREGDIAVTTAADPLIARGKMRQSRPDVLLLDIEMPRMNGLRFLQEIMAEDPLPVVMCSSHVAAGTRHALEAMALGAVDIILKPEMRVREFLEESRITISDVVRAAACAKLGKRGPAGGGASQPDRPSRQTAPKPAGPAASAQEPVVAIGASTGGPGTLAQVLGALSEDVPPILIVQHIPRTFSASFAQNLGRNTRIEVREAVDGDPLRRRAALVAPGGQHMVIARRGRGYCVRLLDGPLVSRHRPSVDVLFSSVAEVASPDSLGIILTGMGTDGVDGLMQMREAGMTTIAQDRRSCVVFGMPREAVTRGAALHELGLRAIAKAIEECRSSGLGWNPAFSATERARRRRLLFARGSARWKTLDPPDPADREPAS